MTTPKSKTDLKDKVNHAASAANPTPGPTKSGLPSQTSPPPPAEQKQTWKSFLEGHKNDIEMVLPSIMRKSGGVERMIRLSLSVVRRRPELLACSPESVLSCLLECSALGLEPETPLQQAHLIPFKNSKTGTQECTLIIDYRALIDLAYRSGSVLTIYANAVYLPPDEFHYSYGTDEHLKHVEKFDSTRQDPKNVTHFYAYAKLKERAYRFVVWSADQVRSHRDRFSASWQADKTQSPWATDFIAMGCKTMVRQLSNWLPRSAENYLLHRALQADDKPPVQDPFAYNFDDQTPQLPNLP